MKFSHWTKFSPLSQQSRAKSISQKPPQARLVAPSLAGWLNLLVFHQKKQNAINPFSLSNRRFDVINYHPVLAPHCTEECFKRRYTVEGWHPFLISGNFTPRIVCERGIFSELNNTSAEDERCILSAPHYPAIFPRLFRGAYNPKRGMINIKWRNRTSQQKKSSVWWNLGRESRETWLRISSVSDLLNTN